MYEGMRPCEGEREGRKEGVSEEVREIGREGVPKVFFFDFLCSCFRTLKISYKFPSFCYSLSNEKTWNRNLEIWE